MYTKLYLQIECGIIDNEMCALRNVNFLKSGELCLLLQRPFGIQHVRLCFDASFSSSESGLPALLGGRAIEPF